MRSFNRMATYGGWLLTTALLIGCGASKTAPPASPDDGGNAEHAEHDHSAEGPHGGSLIELGNEYHAELVHDEQGGSIVVYLLDLAAKNSVTTDAPEVMINLKHEGQGEQFKLMASPGQGDPEGQSSRFVSSDAELAEDLHHEGADAQLVVTIGGKQYRGHIQHEHHDHGQETE